MGTNAPRTPRGEIYRRAVTGWRNFGSPGARGWRWRAGWRDAGGGRRHGGRGDRGSRWSGGPMERWPAPCRLRPGRRRCETRQTRSQPPAAVCCVEQVAGRSGTSTARPLERVALWLKDRRAMSVRINSRTTRSARRSGPQSAGRNRSTAHGRFDGGPCLPIGPCSPTLRRSANSRSRPEAAAPRHIRGDPRAGSVRAERPSAGHRCPVLSLMVALRGEVRALGSADLPPFSTVPRSRRLGNHSRPPDAPELRASEQGP